MVGSRDFTRIDTLELKDIICKKIGRQRAKEYFQILKTFLSSKLSKAEFDSCCIRAVGRENIRLHNCLIRAIIQNSNQAKLPPHKASNVHAHENSGSLESIHGVCLPVSPRKCRSPVNRERKLRDRPSPLGPLGKSLSLTYEETISRIQEQSAAELHSICSKPPAGAPVVEEGEEVEQCGEIPCDWRSVTPPFRASIKPNSGHTAPHSVCQSSGDLPDTLSLMSCLGKKLASSGVSISLEGANAINRGLDAFLKRLMESSAIFCQQDGHMVPNQAETQHRLNVNMLGICLAMETNPSVFGENRPALLEKF